MPRAFARRRKAKRGPDKLDFAVPASSPGASAGVYRRRAQGHRVDEREKIADRSCWCSKRNSVRQKAIQIYLHPLFNTIIMWLIIANAIVLLFVDPLDKTTGTRQHP